MARICGWCKVHMGHAEGVGVTHGICQDCEREHFPSYYAAKREEDAMRRGEELLARRNDHRDTEAFARVVAWDVCVLADAA